MKPCRYTVGMSCTVLFLTLIANAALAAAPAPGKKSDRAASPNPSEEVKPKLLNAGSNTTLRYPASRLSGRTSGSLTYGWFDVSRTEVRYTVVQPKDKEHEGYTAPLSIVERPQLVVPAAGGGHSQPLMIIWDPSVTPWTAQLLLAAANVGSHSSRRSNVALHFGIRALEQDTIHMHLNGPYLYYVSEDRWGQGIGKASVPGTRLMAATLADFDAVVAAILITPVRDGNLAAIQALLPDNPDLAKERDKLGMTPLHAAVAGGHLDMMEFLLSHGADINARSKDGDTPLHEAVAANHQEAAQLLLAKGANVNARRGNGTTALMLAFANGRRDMVNLLLAAGADVNARTNTGETPLMTASARCHKDDAEFLLAKGAEVNAATNIEPTQRELSSESGTTPLILASRIGCRDVAELLLAKGADVNAKTNMGTTALIAASQGGQVVWGLVKGADGREKRTIVTLQPGASGRSPLVISQVAQNGVDLVARPAPEPSYKEVADLLLAKGADVNARETYAGGTALDWAAAGGFRDVAELLRRHGAKTWEPAGASEAINAAAALLGTQSVERVRQQARGDFVVSEKHPIRVHLAAPPLPVVTRPNPDVHGHLGIKGDWDIIGNGGLMFAGSEASGGWYLDSGELQFRGSVAVGSSLVVFLSGEIRSTAPDKSSFTEGAIAQVDGVQYVLAGQDWKLKK